MVHLKRLWYITSAYLSLVALAPTDAAEWWYLGAGSHSTPLYFADEASATRTGNYSTIWFYTIEKNAVSGVKSRKIKMTFDCVNQKMGVTDTVSYDSSDAVLSSNLSTPYIGESVIPDTTGEWMIAFGCRGTAADPKFVKIAVDPTLFAQNVFASNLNRAAKK